MEEIVEIFSENKFQKPFEDTVYKVTCLYKGKTELYERMLIEKEYKYNSSKAFCDKKFQDASFRYRHKLLEEIEQQYKVKPKDIEYEINVHNYSENKWVDEYERLWKGGEKI